MRLPEGASPRWVAWGVAAAAVFAALRVALLAAWMPLYAHLDEDTHYDLVQRYAHGDWPAKGADAFGREALELGARYQSPEWQRPLTAGPMGHALPGMLLDEDYLAGDAELRGLVEEHPEYVEAVQVEIERQVRAAWERGPNYEAFQPPVYYLLAAGWWRLGGALGFEGPGLLLWTRWLGALVAAGAVVATWWLARFAVPGSWPAALGAAALVALAPQDVLACVNNDVLGVLLGPLALLASAGYAIAVAAGRIPGPWRGLGVGLLLAVVGLVKPTNAPMVLAGLVALWPAVRHARRSLVPVVVGLGVPVAMWCGYALLRMGELTGSKHKTELMRFAPQTWASLAEHPVTTLEGWMLFVGDTVTRAWRGELHWHDVELGLAWSDGVYLGVTLLGLLAAALLGVGRRQWVGFRPPLGVALWVGTLGAPALLLAISLAWDFREAYWPTPAYPWFTNARLVFASFPAFAILVAAGTARWIGARGLAALVVVVAVTVVVSEVWLHRGMAASPHSIVRLTGW